MIVIGREDIITIAIIISCTILTYSGILTPDQYLYVLGLILSFYFGRAYQAYSIYSRVAKITEMPKEYKDMIRRFGSILLISGITLLLEKFITSGATLTYPPIWDHALWGLLMTILGWIILIRKGNRE